MCSTLTEDKKFIRNNIEEIMESFIDDVHHVRGRVRVNYTITFRGYGVRVRLDIFTKLKSEEGVNYYELHDTTISRIKTQATLTFFENKYLKTIAELCEHLYNESD